MNEFFCEHPGHVGERRVENVRDQYVVTVDIMRADGKERAARVGPAISGGHVSHPGGLRVCHGCALRLRTALKAGVAKLDPGQGWVAPEQGTLV